MLCSLYTKARRSSRGSLSYFCPAHPPQQVVYAYFKGCGHGVGRPGAWPSFAVEHAGDVLAVQLAPSRQLAKGDLRRPPTSLGPVFMLPIYFFRHAVILAC